MLFSKISASKLRKLSLYFRLLLIVSMVLIPSLNYQTVSAFHLDKEGHIGITERALGDTQRVVDDETLEFTPQAIKEIVDANKETDSYAFPNNQLRPELHFDDESFAASTRRLVDLKASIISKISGLSPDGEAARRDLGGALHTLQDFYAHTNWVELGNSEIDTRLGRSTYAGLPLNIATCPNESDTLGGAGLTSLTSGWFKGKLTLTCFPPAGKCRHGFPGICPSGLNKDTVGPNHSARILAFEASKDFLNQILDAPSVKNNAKAIKALMRINGTLGIVIDDTGSMGNDIAQVKSQVKNIIDDVRDTPKEPDEYLLVRFGDPDVGSPFITKDPDEFISAVNALSAHGGGDCPELSATAELRAVTSSRNDSTIFSFTDASAKDGALASNVIAEALDRRIDITKVLTGSCSPIDPTYIRITNETGGQLFVLERSEVNKVFDLVSPQLSGDFVSIFSTSGTADESTLNFDIPVDSSITNVVFSVSIDVRNSVTVRRPSGEAVTPNDSDVQITELNSGSIVSVSDPVTGTWGLEVVGSGAYSAIVKGNSSIDFRSFDFVRLSEDRHPGLLPIPGQPLIGEVQTGLASMFGPVDSATFTLVDEIGNTIQSIPLISDNSFAASYEFAGEFTPPNQPFKVLVHGQDSNGVAFQRLFPALFRTQSVEVAVETTVSSLPAGTTSRVSFSVHNLGDPETFQIQVNDNLGFVSLVQPSTVVLDRDGRAIVEVDITVPASTAGGTEVSLSAVATSNSDPFVTNSATLDLAVIGLPDLVIQNVIATEDNIQVVIKNQGSGPVQPEHDFWVDVYIDPDTPPVAVNDVWDFMGSEGLVWGVVAPAVPMQPGDTVTLSIGDGYYWPSLSNVPSPIPLNIPIYAQIDSANSELTYGGVLESHEAAGGAYNNIFGPVMSQPSTGGAGEANEKIYLPLITSSSTSVFKEIEMSAFDESVTTGETLPARP